MQSIKDFHPQVTLEEIDSFIKNEIIQTEEEYVEILNSKQKSIKWINAKYKRMGSSEVGYFLDHDERKKKETFLKEKLNKKFSSNVFSEYGNIFEDRCMEFLNMFFKLYFKEKFQYVQIILTGYRVDYKHGNYWFGASADGLLFLENYKDGVCIEREIHNIEIKSLTSKGVPEFRDISHKYFDQIQTATKTEQNKKCYFCQYKPDMIKIEEYALNNEYCTEIFNNLRYIYHEEMVPMYILKNKNIQS